MTDAPPTLEERVAALEARWLALEERVAMEAGLRAAGDRDLATVGQGVTAVRRLVQAVALTQADYGVTLAGHGLALTRLEGRVDQLAGTVDGIQRVQGEHGAALGRIVSMLDELIRREPGGAGQPDLT